MLILRRALRVADLLHPTVVIADHPRNLPRPILVLPQMNELRLAHIAVPRMVKAMHPNLHRSIPMDRIHLQRPRTSSRVTFPQMLFLIAVRNACLPTASPVLSW